MLEDERAVLVHVAFVANGVLRSGQTDLLRQFGAVRIVAVGALHKSLVYSMVKGHGKLGLLL
jgi:hypothetical protein